MKSHNPTFPDDSINISEITFESLKHLNTPEVITKVNTRIPQEVKIPSEVFSSLLSDLGVAYID